MKRFFFLCLKFVNQLFTAHSEAERFPGINQSWSHAMWYFHCVLDYLRAQQVIKSIFPAQQKLFPLTLSEKEAPLQLRSLLQLEKLKAFYFPPGAVCPMSISNLAHYQLQKFLLLMETCFFPSPSLAKHQILCYCSQTEYTLLSTGNISLQQNATVNWPWMQLSVLDLAALQEAGRHLRERSSLLMEWCHTSDAFPTQPVIPHIREGEVSLCHCYTSAVQRGFPAP